LDILLDLLYFLLLLGGLTDFFLVEEVHFSDPDLDLEEDFFLTLLQLCLGWACS
jgi:hypothetical protein